MIESTEQARLHEEYKLQKLESERRERVRDGKCTVCGKPLNFADKLARRHDHKTCSPA